MSTSGRGKTSVDHFMGKRCTWPQNVAGKHAPIGPPCAALKGWGQRLPLSSQAGRRNEAVIDVGMQWGQNLSPLSWAQLRVSVQLCIIYCVFTHRASAACIDSTRGASLSLCGDSIHCTVYDKGFLQLTQPPLKVSVHLLHLWWRSSALTVKPHCSVSLSCPLTFPSHLPSSLALCVLLLPSLLLGCHVRVSGWHWEDCCICISLLTTAGGEFTNTVTRWLGIKQLLRWNGCALLRVLPCNRDPSKWRTLSWKHHNYSCCQSKSTPKSEISAGAAKAVVPNLTYHHKCLATPKTSIKMQIFLYADLHSFVWKWRQTVVQDCVCYCCVVIFFQLLNISGDPIGILGDPMPGPYPKVEKQQAAE